jgi:hypothetical protein
MKRTRFIYAGLLTFSLLTGCASQNDQAVTGHNDHKRTAHQQHAPNGDLQERTASVSQLPSFLDNLDPQIKAAYQIAAANHELLQSIPCYCGCGESAGHLHNGNCFIKEVKADGSVIWDDHGTRCGTCMEIAVVSAKLKQEGKSVKEIRAFIDNAYKDGYAKPTPTPMPS